MARLTGIIHYSITRWIAACTIVLVLVIILSRTWITAYANPVPVAIELSANFGEIRAGHWHMGLDIRTNGRENMPVFAVAEGYISRIGISAEGYGKVLYITHKNNRTSVYAHLNSFGDEIDLLVHRKQQEIEQWEQDIILPAGQFVVNKGQKIALSGNTGHSEGPHLHFEWRETSTGNCLNPQLELFRQRDDLPPVLEAIYWYDQPTKLGRSPDALPSESESETVSALKSASVSKSALASKSASVSSASIDQIHKEIPAKQKLTIITRPEIILGITAIDKMNGSRFNLGVYDIRLFMDDSLIYQISMNNIPVMDTRNSDYHIDYATWRRKEQFIQLLRDPDLTGRSATRRGMRRGVIDISDGQDHKVRLELRDLGGNLAARDLVFRYVAANRVSNNMQTVFAKHDSEILTTDNSHQQRSQDFIVRPVLPVTAKTPLVVRELHSENDAACFPVISVNEGRPLPADSVMVRLRARRSPDAVLAKKMVLLITNYQGSVAIPGVIDRGWFAARIGSSGTARVVVDTIAPRILLNGWKNRESFSKGDVLKIIVKDNLRQVMSFRAEINDRWTAFDRKGDEYSLVLKGQVPRGNNQLRIRVADAAGNITRNVFHFQY